MALWLGSSSAYSSCECCLPPPASAHYTPSRLYPPRTHPRRFHVAPCALNAPRRPSSPPLLTLAPPASRRSPLALPSAAAGLGYMYCKNKKASPPAKPASAYAAAPPPPPSSGGGGGGALPPGWTSAVDPTSRQTYYTNTATGASQWTPPSADAAPPPPPPAAPPRGTGGGMPPGWTQHFDQGASASDVPSPQHAACPTMAHTRAVASLPLPRSLSLAPSPSLPLPRFLSRHRRSRWLCRPGALDADPRSQGNKGRTTSGRTGSRRGSRH